MNVARLASGWVKFVGHDRQGFDTKGQGLGTDGGHST